MTEGALTFERLQQAMDDALTAMEQPREPELLIVSWEAMQAMKEMPGGPSWDNYTKYLMKRYRVE